MEASTELAYGAAHLVLAFFISTLFFSAWRITRQATLRLFSRSWVHWVARLGVWVFLPAMFFVEKSTQDILMVGIFLCCQPALLRWVIAADLPNPSLVPPQQLSVSNHI